MSWAAIAGAVITSGIGAATSGGGGDGPQMPAAPDFMGIAQQDLQANRPTQISPYGSVQWTRDANGNWTQRTTLNAAQQGLLNSQNNISASMAKRLGDYLHRTNAVASGDAGQVGYNALMARYQPQIQQSHAMLQNQLANQGIMPGSEAYTNAMRTQQQGENDLMSQAAMYGQQTGMQMQRNSMDMLNAARAQSTPTMPSFTSFAPSNLLGAATQAGNYAQGVYNGQVGQYNANGGALGPIGSAALNLGSSYLAGGGKVPSFGGLFGSGGSAGGGFTQPGALGINSGSLFGR